MQAAAGRGMSRLHAVASHVCGPVRSPPPPAAATAITTAPPPPGVVPAPRVCTDPAEALRCCRRDGACIYQAFQDSSLLSKTELEAALVAVAPAVFASDVAVAQPPIAKFLGIGNGRTRPGDLGMEPNLPHMDTAYGMVSNDWLIITNDDPADSGGESVLLDGYGLLAGLAPPMRQAMEEVQMLHGGGFVAQEKNQFHSTGSAREGVAAVRSPCLTVTAEGRQQFCTPTGGGIRNEDGTGGITNWLCVPAPDQPQPQIEAGQLLRLTLRDAVLTATPHAPRFLLQRGQYLIADNYRMFHGREVFTGSRTLRRVWFWSKQARPEALAFAPSVANGGAPV